MARLDDASTPTACLFIRHGRWISSGHTTGVTTITSTSFASLGPVGTGSMCRFSNANAVGNEIGLGHHDVFLPAGWHLNQENVHVPPASLDGRALEREM
jgi:hypothetical protein